MIEAAIAENTTNDERASCLDEMVSSLTTSYPDGWISVYKDQDTVVVERTDTYLPK